MNIVEELEKAANSEILNKTIQNLSEKFGIATDNIMNSVIKYGRNSNITSMIIWLLILFVTIAIFFMLFRYIDKEYEKLDTDSIEIGIIIMIIDTLFFMLSFAFSLGFIYQTIMWFSSPDVMAIKYILEQIK